MASLAEQEFAARIANGTDPAQHIVTLPLSDTTNAQRLIALHGADLRYCQDWRKWLVYTGTHWELDSRNRALYAARETAKAIAVDAAELRRRVDEEQQQEKERSPEEQEHLKESTRGVEAFNKHAKATLNTPRMEAMLKAAWPDLAVTPKELQDSPWLLNCLNGTVNLQTGEISTHRREDNLMHCLPVAYDPEASCERWQQFLAEIFNGDHDLIDFIWRAIGYSLTGDVQEQVIFILHGTGENGKSTLLNCLLELLGEQLAMKATSELLLTSREDRHPTEKADLFQRRFVCCIETQEGRRFNETFLKEATGGDPIRARRMHEDPWQFWPTHKIWLATNHEPEIRGTDHAIWRRIRKIPFNVTFTDVKDATLSEKLKREWPGILAWAVRGCQAWLKDGLKTPSVVIDATNTYKAQMDVLSQFIEECCEILPEATVKRSALLDAYVNWCQRAGEERLKERTFGERLIERGFERYTNNGTWYRGIGLCASDSDHERRDWA